MTYFYLCDFPNKHSHIKNKEEKYFNLKKFICDKPSYSIIVNCEKLKAFPLRSGTREGCPLSLFFSIVLEVLARAIRQEKEIKDIYIGKEDVKMSLFVVDMMLCVEHPKNSTKKLLESVNKYNQVAGYKISVQQFTTFLYTNN